MFRALALITILVTPSSCSSQNGRKATPAPPNSAVEGSETTAAAEPSEAPATAPDRTNRAGYEVLRGFVELFQAFAKSGNPDAAIMLEELDTLSARANELHGDGKIDDGFLKRYERLVRVTKLVFEPAVDEARRVEITRELTAFVQEVEGSDREVDPYGGLAEIGAALAEEIVSLYMLVDGSTDRQATREKYMK
jgi:hypothetical protein